MDKILFSNIRNLIKDGSNYFDEGIAEYLLKRITPHYLKNELMNNVSIQNFNIKSNIWATIKHIRKDSIFYINTKDSYDQENEKREEIWKNLLNKIDPDLTKNTEYILIKTKGLGTQKEYKVNFNGMLALYNLKDWYKLYLSDKDTYQLTPNEEKILTEDIIENEQYYTLYKTDLSNENYKGLEDFILELINKNLKEIKKLHNKSDEEIVMKLLSSNITKLLISNVQADKLGLWFSEESLRSIFKKSSLKDNLDKHINMLSNLLPIAPSSKWINSLSQTGNFDLFTIFSPLIEKSSSYKLKEIKELFQPKTLKVSFSAKKAISKNAIKEINNRLDYFKEDLKLLNIKEIDLINWYTLVMLTENKELYQKSLKIFPFPILKENSSKETIDFFNHRIYKKAETWMKESDIEVQKNKLEELLSEKDTINKKIKI